MRKEESLKFIEQRLTLIEHTLSMLSTPALNTERYLTKEDLRKIFRISLPTVDSWIKQGIFKAYRIGNRVYFRDNEVKQALEGKL